jgi:pyrroloquinoline quinone (PQQ) biosynthesis protein C
MVHAEKNWEQFPKFRHNLWTNFADEPDVTYLTVSHGKFKVATGEAQEFLKIRGLCTGHHDLPEIAQRSGLTLERTREIVRSLVEGDVLRQEARPFAELGAADIQAGLLAAAGIWAEQLRETHIAVDVFNGTVSRRVATGWLLETYHYIRQFPAALEVAARAASGELRQVLAEYARQERGHETFVEQTLVRLGLRPEEIRQSVPLATTRLIDLLMREMFAAVPCSALLLASIVEADDLAEGELPGLQEAFARHHGAPADCLAPFFQHSQIDSEFGHGRLAHEHVSLLQFRDGDELHETVNRLHDIKHAFDAQKLEIKDYYGREGNYFPRQRVDFFSI